jgi:hypothetical protein
MVKQRMVCRSLFVGALLIGGAGCNGVVPSDQPDGVETILSPVVYDNGQRPVPRSFLSLRTSGTKCCVGSAATGCSQLCSDSNGLVTQAGMDKTAEYYSATYQYGLTTLDKFKDYYNIPQRRPGELLRDYRQRAGIVVYYNASELGLGRELGCGETASGANYRVGCYVSNFGDSFASMDDPNSNTNREFNSNGTHTGLYNATMGIQPKGTVCISYDVTRPADHKVQFAAYDARGDRTDKAQLDTMGARPVPEICSGIAAATTSAW